MIHILVIRVLNEFIGESGFYMRLLITILVLFISLFITILLKKIPKLNKIVEI